MKKSRRIVKKMSKKSLINKKALRYIIANSNLCKHAIRELELAGYSKEEDGPNKWMREQVIEAVALFSSHGNSGFSAPFEINLVKKLCSFDIISPLRFDDGEWEKIGLDGSCQNKRKSSIFKEPDGSIHDVDAFSKVPVKKFLFATRTWTENIHKIGWIGGLFETDENGILIGSKERHVFTATFVRFGFRNGYIGPVKTMLLQDVTLDSKIVSDHLWFDLTKGFSGADLSPGDVVEFCARVSAYEKGYKGHKDDVLNRPIERDYRLSRPTKIKKIGKKLILKDEGK